MQITELNRYLTWIQDQYGDDSTKMLLTGTTAALYPLYIASGVSHCGPILIHCCDSCQAEKVIRLLMPFADIRPLPLSASPKDVKNFVKKSEYNVMAFLWQGGRYTKDNLRFIHHLTLYGEEAVLAFVIDTNSNVSESPELFGGEIYLDNAESGGMPGNEESPLDEIFMREEIHYAVLRRAEIKAWVKNAYEKTNFCSFKISPQVLLGFFTSLGMDKDSLQKIQNSLKNAMESMENDWEGGNDAETIAEIFCKAVLDSTGWVSDIVNRKRVLPEKWEKLSEAIWYDEKFYYISETLFHEICEPFRATTSIRTIKRQLSAAGVLVMEGRSRTYGTVRVSAFNGYGECKIERRVKLKRNPIDTSQDLTLIEMFGEREEEA